MGKGKKMKKQQAKKKKVEGSKISNSLENQPVAFHFLYTHERLKRSSIFICNQAETKNLAEFGFTD